MVLTEKTDIVKIVKTLQAATSNGGQRAGDTDRENLWKYGNLGHTARVPQNTVGVVETVVLENSVFVPCRNQVVLTKIGEASDIASYPQKNMGFAP